MSLTRLRTAQAGFLVLACFANAVSAESTSGIGQLKTSTDSARLLIPYFSVDTTDQDGVTTLFAVRNESTDPVNLVIKYFETNNGVTPQLQEPPRLLAGKEVVTINMQQVSQFLTVEDGMSHGFVIVEAVEENATLQGDYFLLDRSNAFASANRMVNIDPQSADNELCSRFSMRYLDSELVFDSGTIFTIWTDLESPPADPPDVFAYSVFDNTGGPAVFSTSYQSSRVAFEVSAADLREVVSISTSEFGVIEIDFVEGVVGHASMRMSAFGQFSVGFEATCLD